MSRTTHNQTNFTAGELSPKLYGRVDIAKYGNGVATLQNMISLIQGGAIARNGTRYVAPTKYGAAKKTRLISFVFNRDQSYMLEFGDFYIRFYRDGVMIMDASNNLLPYEVDSPYSEDVLDSLDFAQQADTMIIACRSISPYRLQRFGDARWQMSTIPFISVPTQEIGYTPNAYAEVDSTPITGQVLSVGDTVAIYSYNLDSDNVTKLDSGEFIKSDVGRYIAFPGGLSVVVKKWTDASNLTALVKNVAAAIVGPQTYEPATWTMQGSAQASLKPSAKGPIGSEITLTAGGVGTIGSAVAISSYEEPSVAFIPSYPNNNVYFRWLGNALWGYLIINTGSAHGLSTGDLFVVSDFSAIDGVTDVNGVYKVRHKISSTKIVCSRFMLQAFMAEAVANINAAGVYGSYGNVQKASSSGSSFPTFRPDDLGGVIAINGGLARVTGIQSPSKVDAIVTKELSSAALAIKNSWSLSLPCWNSGAGYPGAVTIASQRLIFAGSPAYPNSVWMSRVAEYYNNDAGVDDSDAINITISSKEVVDIQHMTENSGIVVLSTGGEYAIIGGVERPITPTNAQIKAQSAFGCAEVAPIRIGSEVFYPQRASKRIRAMSYQYSSDSYNSPDISALSDHLIFDGIKSMAYQQEPYSVLWIVTKSGGLVSCTIDREQNVIAWARHDSGNAVFESVAAIPNGDEDQVWLSVKRTIKDSSNADTDVRYVERFDSDLYHDCVSVEVPLDYVAEADALFARCSTEPSDAEKLAKHNLICAAMACGAWSKLDALYIPKKAAVEYDGLLDWKRAVSATKNGSAAWTQADGFVGSSVAGSYFGTEFNPLVDGVNVTASDLSFAAYVANTSATPTYDVVMGTGTVDATETHLFGSTGLAYELRVGGAHRYTAASQVGAGLICVACVGGVISLYKNGTSIALSGSGSPSALTNRELRLLDVNGGQKVSAWWVGAPLTTAQQMAFKAALDDYWAAI